MFLFSGRNEKPGVKVEETSFITAAFKSTWFYFYHKILTRHEKKILKLGLPWWYSG